MHRHRRRQHDAAYVAGATQSPDFPVTAGAFQRVYGGQSSPLPGLAGDAFVANHRGGA